jgi:hypothetical protein
VTVITEPVPCSDLVFHRGAWEGDLPASIGNVIFWAALTVSGILDFTATTSLCIIVIGIDRACRCALADANCLSALFS